ncbi:MAG: putative DNA-binding domain-containing protein [Verrucomicrobia bacterium]|nr:putative DNA-binding domain-containing protein [Verrucomicrobiota bacterium]MBS0636191.1 putative DNA-binding domain-containing protein [Verrucomicrobiota bacterium]
MTLPESLLHIQKWFGGIITQELSCDIDNASRYIVETKTLTAEERMRIYNYSYWLRLYDALHDEYPFLSRLFGKDSFDEEISTPFLQRHPPSHWSLNLLGIKLPEFLDTFYTASDRALVLKACFIDWACQRSFFAVSYPELNLTDYAGDDAEKLLTCPLRLQSHVHLFEANGHMMRYREAFLKEEHDYWLKADFPPLDKEKLYYFIIFRNSRYTVEWDTLEPDEYRLLTLLESGLTLDEAVDKIPESDDIALWIQKWLLRQWLCKAS